MKLAGKNSCRQKGHPTTFKEWDKLARLSALDRVRGAAAWEGSYWKTFVGRDGSFSSEPYPFQISFWVWDSDEKKLYTPQTLPTVWKLAEGCLPVNIINWAANGVEVETSIFACPAPFPYGAKQLSPSKMLVNFARTSLENKSSREKTVSLYVIIRQNPVPKSKGDKELKEIKYTGCNWVSINSRQCLYLVKKPDLSEFDTSVGKWAKIKLLDPVLKWRRAGKSAGETIHGSPPSAALVYNVNLKPHSKRKYDFIVPSPEKNKKFIPADVQKLDFDSNLKKTKEYWKKRVPMELRLPDKRYADMFYSSVYNLLLLMDGDLLYPGPADYFRFFLHDAVGMAEALDKVGLHDLTASAVKHFNYKEGGGYLDELGGNIYGVFSHYLMTRDVPWLRKFYPRMIKKCRLLKKLRAKNLRPSHRKTPFYGLLPTSVSQDAWKFPSHLYIDDWWGLVGLKSAIAAAKVLKKTGDLKWLSDEYDDLHKCLLDSMEKARMREGVNHYPAFADYWPPSKRKIDQEHRILGEAQMAWAHRPALYPGQALGIEIPLDEFKKSYQSYWKKAGKFSGYDGGWFVEYENFFWGYNVKLAHPLIYLGMEKTALKNIEWSLRHQSCPGGWMEAMPSRINKKGLREINKNGGIVGDVPHGWSAAHYVLLLRDMLLREEGQKLILCSCIPGPWLGDGKCIEIKKAPTYFGELGYRIESRLKKGYIKLTLDTKKCHPEGYQLILPVRKNIRSVKIDGKNWNGFSERAVDIPAAAKEILVRLRRNPPRRYVGADANPLHPPK